MNCRATVQSRQRARVRSTVSAAGLVLTLLLGLATLVAPAEATAALPWPGGPIAGVAGESVTVDATLRPATIYRGRPVRLELRMAGERAWHAVSEAVAGRQGHVVLDMPTANPYRGRVRLRLPASGARPAAVSQARSVRIRQDPAVQAAQFEAEVLALVNEARSSQRWCGDVLSGPAAPLEVDDRLASAARTYAVRMGKEGFFAHVAPNGDTPSDRAAAAGYPGPVGENIAAGPRTAPDVVDGWLHSPGHCQNIMDASYAVTGIGYAEIPDSEYGTYWVQMFGSGEEAPAPDE